MQLIHFADPLARVRYVVQSLLSEDMPDQLRTRGSSPPVFQYVCLAILFAGAMLFQIRYARDIWRAEKIEVPFVLPASASGALETRATGGAKLGLHAGDILLEVNHQKYVGTAILSEAYAKARPGDQIELRVKSASGEHSVVLPVTAGSSAAEPGDFRCAAEHRGADRMRPARVLGRADPATGPLGVDSSRTDVLLLAAVWLVQD
jgi:hypothetical protein